MNFVFLSPHFPPNFHLFCVQLSRLGVRVLAIADERVEALHPELREALTDYIRVPNLNVYSDLLWACQEFSRRYGKLDRIESHNEHWLETQAHLRRDLGIPGMQPEAMPQIKRKSRMKQIYQQAGIPVARGLVARSLPEAVALIAETGYPLVAKPDIGVGAAATYKIHDHHQLAHFYATKPDVDYILEEFIEGTITTYDGLVDVHGQSVFTASLVYSQGVMETVNEDSDIHFFTRREIPQDLAELGERTLAAFGPRESFFHFEYFRQADGQLIALEVNMRPPGSPVLDIFNFSADIDLYRAWAQVVVEGTAKLEFQRKYFICYAGRKEKNHYRHDHQQILQRCAGRLALEKPVPMLFRRAMGDHMYLIRTPDFEEMRQLVRFIQGTG